MKKRHRLSQVFCLLLVSACQQQIEWVVDIHSDKKVELFLGSPHPVNLKLFGSNGVHETSADPVSSEAYRALLRELSVRGIRYPSGSPASFWDWQTGHFIPENEITAIWPAGAYNWMLELVEDTQDVPDHVLGPIKFSEFGQDINAEVQWMLNLTTREHQQIPSLKDLKLAGEQVKYVEMDNETYFWSEEFGNEAPALVYANRVKQLSPSIRKLFPEVKIGIVTREEDLFEAPHTNDETVSEAMRKWNPTIMSADFTPHFDALILHHYVMKKQKLDPYVNDIDRGKAFLAYPTATLERAAKLIKQRYGDYKMWITEYNVIAYYPQFHGQGEAAQWMLKTRDTGWNSLYQISFILNGINNPDAIEVLNHHSINNLDYGWGLGAPIDLRSGRLTKMGQIFSHLSAMSTQYTSMHGLNFNRNPSLDIAIEGDTEQAALYGAALTEGTRTALWIVNRSDEPITISAELFKQYKSATVSTYPAIEQSAATAVVTYQNTTPIWQQGPVNINRTLHMLDDGYTIPGFSFVILELGKTDTR